MIAAGGTTGRSPVRRALGWVLGILAAGALVAVGVGAWFAVSYATITVTTRPEHPGP